MRKACIDLNSTMKIATLCAGDLGGGKCLHHVTVSVDLSYNPTAAEWKTALNECMIKTKYEVSRIRDKRMAESTD
ncbi:Uncharacterised protein [Yersinia kristensenii]|nr:Uncharacterised protein [Yersinia kristensenii]